MKLGKRLRAAAALLLSAVMLLWTGLPVTAAYENTHNNTGKPSQDILAAAESQLGYTTPADGAKYGDLRDALEKLQLNDASLTFEPETSIALGFGFRCGFLGLLHMEIIQERLEREYNLDLITTAPSVIYRVTLTNGEVQYIDNPTNYPDPAVIAKAEEPMVKAEILTPADFVGNVMELCQNRRGVFVNMQYLDDTRVSLHYVLPLNEIV